ncbi:MAG: phage tail assembly chaperone [Faecalispora jeddahensis]
MKITSNVEPSFSFVRGNPCVVTFVENITDNGDGTWTYDQYTLTADWRVNLQAQISAYYADWLQKAKDAEYTAEAAKVRAYRDSLLTECDTLYTNAENWALMDKTTRTAWQTYKQALRDVSEQESFPYSVAWPVRAELVIDRSAPSETEILQQTQSDLDLAALDMDYRLTLLENGVKAGEI